jgi:hypothetical protein
MLLIPAPLVYDDSQLKIFEEASIATPLRGGSGASAAASTPFVPRAAAGKRRALGLGAKRGTGLGVSAAVGRDGERKAAPSFVAAGSSAGTGPGAVGEKKKALGQDAFRDMLK